jgi:hypothetical protein
LISETVHQQLWLFWLLIIVAGRHLVMRANRGSSLPKKGKALHRTDRESGSGADYAAAIAEALRHDLGKTHRAVKSVMRWTGASERTVKYWLAGAGGPSGEHLIALARHSDTVLQMILRLADHRRAKLPFASSTHAKCSAKWWTPSSGSSMISILINENECLIKRA